MPTPFLHSAHTDLISPTSSGLYCAAGDFYIDPWKSVPRALITHAHSDHARPGSDRYLCAAPGAGVLRTRIGPAATIQTLPYGEPLTLNSARVSFHPAGHVLGSSQIRIEHITTGEIWVVSGDYKTIADRTCTPFEPVRCSTFITESTFGLPIYRWSPQARVFDQINRWWRDNQSRSVTSILLAYSLGKAQRLLAGVDPAIGPIVVHGSIAPLNAAYRAAGIPLPDAPVAIHPGAPAVRGRGLVIAPPSALGTPWVRRFASGPAEGISAAFASGWMHVRGTRRRLAVDRGFVLSDHADWPGLLTAIDATGAERVGVTHGATGPLVRWLNEHNRQAFTIPTRFVGEIGEYSADEPRADAPAHTTEGVEITESADDPQDERAE